MIRVTCSGCGAEGFAAADADEVAAVAAAGLLVCPDCVAGLTDRVPGCGLVGCECQAAVAAAVLDESPRGAWLRGQAALWAAASAVADACRASGVPVPGEVAALLS